GAIRPVRNNKKATRKPRKASTGLIIAIHIAIFISRSTFPIRPLKTLRGPQHGGSLLVMTLWFTGFRMVAVGSARFIAEKIGRLVVLRLATKKSKSFGGSRPTRVQLKSFHELNASAFSLSMCAPAGKIREA